MLNDYKNLYEPYNRAAKKGRIRLLVVVLFSAFVVSIGFAILGGALGWFNNAQQTMATEFSPSALLKKYEWFKDASAVLDKKLADIQVYETRFESIKESYGENIPRSQWSREDKETYNLWLSEVAGIKASYNQLAAEYNSAMSKFNWKFTNIGDLPAGATMPLPREYKPYTTN